MTDIKLTSKEKVIGHLKANRSVVITHEGTSDNSVDIYNYAIFIEDSETEKELVSNLFLKFSQITTIEVIRFQLYSTIYERTTK